MASASRLTRLPRRVEGKKIPAKQRAAIDAALPRSRRRWSPLRARQLLDSAVSSRLSLYVDSGYSTYSIIGAALLANLIEKGRVSTIRQFATRSADDVSARLQDLPDAERIAALNAGAGGSWARKAGFYVVGGRGDKLLADMLDKRVFSEDGRD